VKTLPENLKIALILLEMVELTLRQTQRYGKEFELKGMELDSKKSLAAVRKAMRLLKQD
jgi:hypothetical protein